MVRTRSWMAFIAVLWSIFLLILTSGTAVAETYFDKIAAGLQSSHVYADPKAVPPAMAANKIAELNQQIIKSGLPIYIAQVNVKQTIGTPAKDLPAKVYQAVRKPGIYGVFSDRFVAKGFDVSPELAAQAEELATNAFNAHKTAKLVAAGATGVVVLVPYEVCKNFVTAMEEAQRPPDPGFLDGIPDLQIFFGIIFALVCLFLLYIIPPKYPKSQDSEPQNGD